jgi:hypothetical protein
VQRQPPPSTFGEVNYVTALSTFGAPATQLAFDRELTKILHTYHATKPIDRKDIEPNAVFLSSSIFYKEKLDGRITARLATHGNRQPPDSYNNIFASTSDVTNLIAMLVTGLTHAANTDQLSNLLIGDFDIPGFFLQHHLPRSESGGRQLILQLPKDLPSTLAGTYHEITGCLYGLKQSNRISKAALTALLLTIPGCYSHPLDDNTFCIADSTTSSWLLLKMHVDDGFYVTNSQRLATLLITTVDSRYGPGLVHNPVSSGTCGIKLERNPDHSIKLHMGPFLTKLLHRAGMDAVPPALTPSLPGLFELPANTTTIDRPAFQRTVGALVYTLPIRGDIAKEIKHLCGRSSTAVQSDDVKLTHLLRYLKGSLTAGPTFSSLPTPTRTVELSSSSDASHNVHPDGRSQSTHSITIGCAPTAPVLVYSGPEKTCIPLSPMEAEYVSTARAAKPLLYLREFVSHLAPGFPQTKPSDMSQDNMSSINLTTSPSIPTKSRYIALRHHWLRDLFQRGLINPLHTRSQELHTDFISKNVGPSKFYYDRSQLFNEAPPLPLQPIAADNY